MSTENLTKKNIIDMVRQLELEFCVNCFIQTQKNILLETVKNLLRDYNLPTKIDKGDFVKKKNILLEHIYKNIIWIKENLKIPSIYFYEKNSQTRNKRITKS